jgi:hypothetical protein
MISAGGLPEGIVFPGRIFRHRPELALKGCASRCRISGEEAQTGLDSGLGLLESPAEAAGEFGHLL